MGYGTNPGGGQATNGSRVAGRAVPYRPSKIQSTLAGMYPPRPGTSPVPIARVWG